MAFFSKGQAQTMKAEILNSFRGSDGVYRTKADGFYDASEREIVKLERAGCVRKVSNENFSGSNKTKDAETKKALEEKAKAEKAEAEKADAEKLEAKKAEADKLAAEANKSDDDKTKSEGEGNAENSPQGSRIFPQGRGNRRGGPANNP